jgi:carbon-monoxide dehydrogenase catalytic subunit
MRFVTEDAQKVVGAHWGFEADPVKCAQAIIAHLDAKREALKLRPMMYEVQDAAAG